MISKNPTALAVGVSEGSCEKPTPLAVGVSVQYHDKLKNKYCKKNNIPLIRIPYWQFDKIEQILDKWLNKYGLTNNNNLREAS